MGGHDRSADTPELGEANLLSSQSPIKSRWPVFFLPGGSKSFQGDANARREGQSQPPSAVRMTLRRARPRVRLSSKTGVGDAQHL